MVILFFKQLNIQLQMDVVMLQSESKFHTAGIGLNDQFLRLVRSFYFSSSPTPLTSPPYEIICSEQVAGLSFLKSSILKPPIPNWNTWFFFQLDSYLEMKSCHVALAGLELLAPVDFLVLASWIARITGLNFEEWNDLSHFNLRFLS